MLTAVVIGLPDGDRGNRLHAIVHTPAGSGLDDAELREFLAERVSKHKLPATFELVHESLRDDAGKVRRSALRAARL